MGLSIRARRALLLEQQEKLKARLELEEAERVLAEHWREQTMTPPEVCRVLRCSRRTLQRMVSRGQLPVIRMGEHAQSRIYFARRDVEQFLARHQPATA